MKPIGEVSHRQSMDSDHLRREGVKRMDFERIEVDVHLKRRERDGKSKAVKK